jgi:hypothetical protein
VEGFAPFNAPDFRALNFGFSARATRRSLRGLASVTAAACSVTETCAVFMIRHEVD